MPKSGQGRNPFMNRGNKEKNRGFFLAFFVVCLGILSAGCGSRDAEFIRTETYLEAQEPEENSEFQQETDQKGKKPEGVTETVSPSPDEPAEIYVDVCGAVARPGVYRLEAESRVFQAIEKAGGLLPQAAGTYVNQAQSLGDGQQVYIPTKEEVKEQPSPMERTKEEGAEVQEEDARVNLNTADAEALMTLTGIGQSKAEAILAWREENGGFSSIEEILNVPGIKEGTFQKIKDNIEV